VQAAFADPRFPQLKEGELPGLRLSRFHGCSQRMAGVIPSLR
jgi:hypothetical protein